MVRNSKSYVRGVKGPLPFKCSSYIRPRREQMYTSSCRGRQGRLYSAMAWLWCVMVTHVGPPGRILLLNTSVSTISSTSTQLGFWATCADWSRKVTGSVTRIAWSRAGFSISSLEFHTMHGGRTLETLSTCMDCLPTLSLGLPI